MVLWLKLGAVRWSQRIFMSALRALLGWCWTVITAIAMHVCNCLCSTEWPGFYWHQCMVGRLFKDSGTLQRQRHCRHGGLQRPCGLRETSGISSHGWELENLAGENLRSLIDAHDLILPATHSGPSSTFRSASGGQSRVDYIGVPLSWAAGIRSSTVDCEFDLLSGDYDHFVVALDLEFSVVPSSGVSRPRRALYDRKKARDSPDLLKQMIVTMPHVPWGVGIDSHWEVLERHCATFLQKWFPLPKRHARQVFFSERTWSLLTARKDTEIQIRSADRRINEWVLCRFFSIWRSVKTQQSATCFTVEVAHSYQERALLLWARKRLDDQFRASRKTDLMEHRATCALDFRRNVTHGDANTLFQTLRPKRPVNRDKGFKMPRPLPAIDISQTDAGEHTRRRYLRVWEAHFSEIEHSNEIKVDELMDYASRSQRCTIDSTFELGDVPTLSSFEASVRQLSWKKAPGFDGFGAECWQGAVAENRRHLYALFLKSAARQYLPIQFRGGFLIPLYKNKGAMSDPASFRGILLQNTAAKIFAKSWRRPLADGLSRLAAPCQFGCRKGVGVSGAHLPLRLHIDSCAATGQAMAVIFIDLKAAYYSVIKELYSSDPDANDERFLQALFGRLGLPTNAMSDFVKYVSRTCLMEDANIPWMVASIVRSTLERSWYQVPTSSALFAPATGTRPGDPLADILFSYAMADILGETYDYLASNPSIQQLPEEVPCGTTWADDTALFLAGDSATIEARAGVAFSSLQEACTRRGLHLSYGPHKTAAVIAFRGPDGKAHHQQFYGRKDPSLLCCLEFSPPVPVKAFFTYKHLGSIIDGSGSLLPEIKTRGSKAYHAVRPLMASCLAKDDIPLQRRRQILQALGISVLTYNTGTWRRLSKGELEAWSTCVWRLYGCMIPRNYKDQHPHISIEAVAHAAGYFLPEAILHVTRLRLLGQLLRHPEDGLIPSIKANLQACGSNSWWACVQEAIQWLSVSSGGAKVVNGLLAIQTPEQLAFPAPDLADGISKAIRKAQKANQFFLQQWIDLTMADIEIKQTLQAAGWMVPRKEQETDSRVHCADCGRFFKDHASLATHRYKAHGIKVAARRFASSTTCAACNKQFCTRPRLIVHLQYSSRRCLPWLLLHSKPISEEEALALDEAAAVKVLEERRSGIRQPDSRMPVGLAAEKKVPQVQLEPITVSRPVMTGIGCLQAEQKAFIDKWASHEGIWPIDDSEWLQFAAELVAALDFCPPECQQTFAGHLTSMIDKVCWQQDDFEIVLEAQDRLAAILHNFSGPRQSAGRPHLSRDERLRQWERDLGSLPVWMGLRRGSARPRFATENKVNIPQRLADQEHSWQDEVGDWKPPAEQIPRVFFPVEVFYLVLFSGHRRFDDIATQIWKLDFGPRSVWPLCLDLCLDQKQGNLLDLEVQAFWKSQIHQGRVIGCHSSPPCETYTEARHIPLPDGQTRPRPLRGWSFPWGFPSLDLKEIKQVTTGNVLFYITAIFVAWVLTHGGCATVEHPQGRKASEGRFTIWFSAFLRRLQQHQECSTFTFCQGYLGQVSLKPTTFLLVRLPMFPRVQRRLAVHKGPFRTLQGKKADGAGWETSAAKEFPPSLCLAIAQSVQAFCLAQSCTDEQSLLTWPDVPAQMWQAFHQSAGWEGGLTMGPDFWG